MNCEELTSRLKGVRKTASGWSARCPAHEDRNSSLSISEGRDGRILMKCFAGCSTENICQALGIGMQDLFPPKEQPRRIVAEYVYTDRNGAPLITVVRFQPKSFARKSPDGRGGWKWGGTGSVSALYHWPELAAACAAGDTIYLVEGEKDCDNGRKAGLQCTTALGGASHWCDAYAKEFKGAAQVIVVADNDEPGRKHARAAKSAISRHGVTCRAVCLPDTVNGRPVKDLSDALAAGWSAKEVAEWCATADEVDVQTAAERRQSLGRGDGGESLEDALALAVEEATEAAHGKLGANERREVQTEAALEWLAAHGSFFFSEEAKDVAGGYYFARDSRELMRISGDFFRSWLSWGSGLSRLGNDWRHLHLACEDAAIRADYSRRISPALFWHGTEDAVYISSGDGQMCRITQDGAEIVDNGTDGVLFRQGRTCRPWKLLPESDDLPCWHLRVLGELATNEPLSPLLLALWILALPRGLKNKPPLSLCGDVGSGKTRTAVGVYELFGMEARIATADKSDRGAEEFWVSVNYGGIATVDNVDSRVKWLADAVSGASTGSQKEKRQLYSDDELVFLKGRSALMITSANPLYATDAGLADRLVNIEFERVPRETSDADLSNEIERNRDRVLSWVAHTISAALRVREAAPRINRRHPDWSAWCWRCGVALGLREETERVLRAAEARKAYVSVVTDPLFGAPLYKWLTAPDAPPWIEMSANELAKKLVEIEDYDDYTKRLVTGHRLGKTLSVNAVAFGEIFGMTSRVLTGTRLWHLERPKSAVQGGLGGFSSPFSNFLLKNFSGTENKESLYIGDEHPPSPPEPRPQPSDDTSRPFEPDESDFDLYGGEP